MPDADGDAVTPERFRALTTGEFRPDPLLVEASSPTTAPARLVALLHDYRGLSVLGPRTEGDEVRDAVLRNPNLPQSEFWDWMVAGSPDIWANPAMDLFLLENPRPLGVLLPYLCRAAVRLVDPPMARLSADWWPKVAAEYLRANRVGGHPFWAKWEATLREHLDAPTPSPEAAR